LTNNTVLKKLLIMRWNCPHCGTQLAISKEKMGAGWSFTRCYSCAGYALIKAGDSHAIKVEKAPANEKVVLPEAFEEPLLNKNAMERLMSYNGKPVVRPARRGQTNTQIPQPSIPFTTPVRTPTQPMRKFPDPLPEVPVSLPTQSKVQKMLPVGVAVAGVIAIVSGIFLYIQGQKIFKKNRAPEKAAITAPAPEVDLATITSQSAPAPETAPGAQAMAVSDRIHQKAMAPEKIITQDTKSQINEPKLMVKPKNNQVKIHSGPGLAYSVIGVANPNSNYIVADWNDRWFKVLIVSKKSANESVHEYGWLRNDNVLLAARYGNTPDLTKISAE
jgi:predicted Zn finger-like uncharacterized protein